MTTEADLYQRLRSAIPGKWTRIENAVTFGMFDTNLAREGQEVWVELKILPGKKLRIRPLQYGWAVDRYKLGGMTNAFFLAEAEDGIYVFSIEYLYAHRKRLIPTKRKMYEFTVDKEIDGHCYHTEWPSVVEAMFTPAKPG